MPACRRSRSSAFDDETIFPSSFSFFPVLVSYYTPSIKRKTPDRYVAILFRKGYYQDSSDSFLTKKSVESAVIPF